jgi:hypothetical protein
MVVGLHNHILKKKLVGLVTLHLEILIQTLELVYVNSKTIVIF